MILNKPEHLLREFENVTVKFVSAASLYVKWHVMTETPFSFGTFF